MLTILAEIFDHFQLECLYYLDLQFYQQMIQYYVFHPLFLFFNSSLSLSVFSLQILSYLKLNDALHLFKLIYFFHFYIHHIDY